MNSGSAASSTALSTHSSAPHRTDSRPGPPGQHNPHPGDISTDIFLPQALSGVPLLPFVCRYRDRGVSSFYALSVFPSSGMTDSALSPKDPVTLPNHLSEGPSGGSAGHPVRTPPFSQIRDSG